MRPVPVDQQSRKFLMKVFWVPGLSVLVITGVLGAQAPDTTRFKDPEGITADPTGLLRDTTVMIAPAYPSNLEAEHVTGAPVVAFVIDTTGRVEIQTASFLNSSRPEFEKAVCDLLPNVRFRPFLVGGQKWRVLLVEMFAFNTWAASDTAGMRVSSNLANSTQEEFSTRPIAGVVDKLASLPHCDLPSAPSSTAERLDAPKMVLRASTLQLQVPRSTSARPPVRVTIEVMVDSTGMPEMATLRLTGYGAVENREALTNWIQQATFQPAYRGGQPVRGLYRTVLEARVIGR